MDVIQKRLKYLERAPMNGETMDDDYNGSNSNVTDIISTLPNEILCHILSFLHTEHAVATSILSTKWKNLFPLIPNLFLQLDDSPLLLPEKSSREVIFLNFVDTLFNVTLRDVASVFELFLHCRKIDDGRQIAKWIDSALRLNVQRMNIGILRLRNSNILLDSLYGANFQHLILLLDFSDAPECRFSLPNLLTLFAREMEYKVLNVLLEGCPSLTLLVVHYCRGDPGDVLHIRIPSLQVLHIISGIGFTEAEMEIDAPNLMCFNYSGFLVNRYSGKKLKSLKFAQLDLNHNDGPYSYESDEQVAKFIEHCSDAEKLLLSENCISTLHNSGHPLPRFQNLVTLGLIYILSSGWHVILSLLEFAPSLKKLVIMAGFDYESYETFKVSLKKSISVSLSQSKEGFSVLNIERGVDN